MDSPIRYFPSKMHSELEVSKCPRHYGARSVQVKANEPSPYADGTHRVWAVKRDGEHYLREDGSWQ